MIFELWREFEEGKTQAARIAQEVDELEAVVQSLIYKRRAGIQVHDFMEEGENITLPQLTPLVDQCRQEHQELESREQLDIVVIFISGMFHQACHLILLNSSQEGLESERERSANCSLMNLVSTTYQ